MLDEKIRAEITKLIDILARVLSPYVEGAMRARWGDGWRTRTNIDKRQYSQITRDLHLLLNVMSEQWGSVFDEKLGMGAKTYVTILKQARNVWAHNNPISPDDAYMFANSAHSLLFAISASDAAEVADIRNRLRGYLIHPGPPQPPSPPLPPQPPAPQPQWPFRKITQAQFTDMVKYGLANWNDTSRGKQKLEISIDITFVFYFPGGQASNELRKKPVKRIYAWVDPAGYGVAYCKLNGLTVNDLLQRIDQFKSWFLDAKKAGSPQRKECERMFLSR